MDSAAEGRPLAIFGWPGRALLPSRIRFWYSFFTFLGYVGRRILCAGACTRPFFLCLGFTLESGFYAQARVPGVLFSNPDSLPKCYVREIIHFIVELDPTVVFVIVRRKFRERNLSQVFRCLRRVFRFLLFPLVL